MDRRSWLWRRKSSEKSPGETESSGSISSHSERFSDDQVYAGHNSQSPEVTSKAVPNDEETNDKSLREKLSIALLNISAKEDLVKQHAKVAEEAVAGWEKAEEEVLSLKHKCSALEDRVGHLDGALKECVRQLRQGREEQEQRIREAIGKKTYEWESTKFELEAQIMQLQAKLEEPDLQLSSRLEASEKELLVRTIERDLSTEAAEAASKQHLEDMRKLAKLEAECKRLSKSSTATDSKSSFAASSVYIESIIDSHSDHATNKPNSIEIGLMDDFLEMERLAAMEEDTGSKSYPISDQGTSTESATRAELEAMIHSTKKMEEEKAELEMSLTLVNNQLKEDESKLRALQAQLAQTIESNVSLEKQLNASNMNTEAAESQLRIVQAEIENLHSRIASLEEELQKERDSSTKTLAKCKKLEDELKRESSSASESLARCRKLEAEVLGMKQGAELHQEKELAVAASKFAECQKTIASLGRQLKSLASLEDSLIDEKSPELGPPQALCPKIELLSSPENINDKESLLPVKANLEPEKIENETRKPEKIENGTGKRLPRGRSRFRKERLRE